MLLLGKYIILEFLLRGSDTVSSLREFECQYSFPFPKAFWFLSQQENTVQTF